MHHCLLEPGVFDRICSQCDDWNPIHERRETWKGSLASLALTSRTYLETALDHLWYEVANLEPLIKCMPDDLWMLKANKWILTRAILPSDWPRFRKNAQRVRRFGFQEDHQGSELSDEAYQAINAAANGHCLLPNLTEFYFRLFEKTGILPFLCLLNSPNLTGVTLRLYHPSLALLSYVANLSVWHPTLTHVEIIGLHEPDEIVALSSAVVGWNEIRRLAIGTLSEDAFIHVAALPKLNHLFIKETSSDPSHMEFPLACHLPTFPALQTLHLECRGSPFALALLRSMEKGSPLKDFSLDTFAVKMTSYEWHTISDTLSSVCQHTALQALCIRDMGMGVMPGPPGKHVMVAPNALKPFAVFTNLTSIELQSPFGFDLDDTIIDSMAKAWPLLEVFDIQGGILNERIPRVSLSSLLSFARYCKSLKRICIALNANSIPEDPATIDSEIAANELQVLDVVDSPISADTREVADFLSRIFPALLVITNPDKRARLTEEDEDDPLQTELDKKWSEVESFIKASKPKQTPGATRQKLLLSAVKWPKHS